MRQTKIFYEYDPETFEYRGEYLSYEVESGFFPTPPNVTEIKPDLNLLQNNQAFIFDKISNSWKIVPDYRGFVLWHKTLKTQFIIEELGKTPSDYLDHTTISFEEFKYSSTVFCEECIIFDESINNWKVQYVSLDLFRQKINKYLEIVDYYYAGKYPKAERDSWSFKVNEATKIINGNVSNYQAETPILYNELLSKLEREPTTQELLDRANEVLTNYNNFLALSGKIAGIRSYLYSITDLNETSNFDLKSFFEQKFPEVFLDTNFMKNIIL